MIYFIQGENKEGPVKIGYTKDERSLEERLVNLQIGCWEELFILAFYPGTRSREKTLHLMFQKDRIRGEWFKFSKELSNIIESGDVIKEYIFIKNLKENS